MDIATLGLAVRPQEVDRASASLDKFSGAASRAEKSAQGLGSGASAAGRAAVTANDNAARSMSRFGGVIDNVKSQMIAFGAVVATAFSAQAILRAADAYTRFGNSLRVAGVAAKDMATVEDRLFAAANRNGAEIEAVSTLYSRASIAATELGTNQKDLLRFIDGTTAALRVQGGSSAAASGALMQLSQALGSGVVRAEEFNSILEGAFPIAQAAARGIDGMGGSVAKLRQAIVDGDITSRVFFEGLLKGFTATEAQAAKMSLTVSGATTAMSNSFTRLIGRLDQSVGASAALAGGISMLGVGMDLLSENLDTIASVATVAGGALLGMFGPAVLAAAASFTTAVGVGAVGAVRALGVAVAANPLGLLMTAIGTAIGLLIVYRSETFKVGDATVEVGKLATAQFRSMIEVIKGAALIMSEFAFAVWKGMTGDFSGAGASFSKIADEAAAASARIRDIWTNLGPDVVDVAGEIDAAMTAAGAAAGRLGNGVSTAADKVSKLTAAEKKAAAEEAARLERIASTIDALELENEQLTALEAAHKAGASALEETNAAIAVQNALIQAGVSIKSAEGAEIARLVLANRDLKGSIDATIEAEKRRKEETEDAAQNAKRAAEDETRFRKDTTASFLSDLRYNLSAGKGLWASFADAATRALDRITDKLLNEVLDALFQVNSAAGGSSGKGGTDWLGMAASALGSFLGGGSTIAPSTTTGSSSFGFSGLYASGTENARRGVAIVGERGPEAVVMRGGERVIPNHRLRAANDRGSQRVEHHTPVLVSINGATGNNEVRQLVAEGVDDGIRKARSGIVQDSVKATVSYNSEYKFA